MNTIAESTLHTNIRTPSTLALMVRQIRHEANGIHSYELVDPAGADLPAATAGAHIDVHLPGGLVRQYSLCNDLRERHRYVIAVLRDANGRGGSRALHESLRVQDVVTVSPPRNHFTVAPQASRHLLLAGGIGITPLKAMAHHFDAIGADYRFHYCCKGEEHAAFREELEAMRAAGKLVLHFDGGRAGAGLDIAALLASPEAGTHLYYCGPAGFMTACANASSHWPAGTVHCEHFKAPQPAPAAATLAPGAPGEFMVQIASSGAMLPVSASQSIVAALGEAGIAIETSCESGLCGTCKVRYLAGEVEHRDYILTEGEQHDYLTACVSRCSGKLLVLDL